MDKLASHIIDAHGGLARWRQFERLTADLEQGGALWGLKGQAGVLDTTSVTVDLKREHAAHLPFGSPERKSSFTPDRVELIDAASGAAETLDAPRASFAGHTLETPWNELQLAYFAGCAMWTYLNMPFLLAWDGVGTQEMDPWQEGSETWRRLRVRFPDTIATHSTEQTLYAGSDGLLRRHDYDVEIAGGTPGAHLIADYVTVEGIAFPTRRRIYPRQPDGQPMAEPLVVSIDLANIRLS